MSVAIRVEVTAEDCAAAGPWPRHDSAIQGWKSPVELALIRLAGVDVDVDGDEDSWHATIGTMEGSTLVVDLPEIANERLNHYYAHQGAVLDPFAFDVALDDWLVALFARATTLEEEVAALDRAEGRFHGPHVSIYTLDKTGELGAIE